VRERRVRERIASHQIVLITSIEGPFPRLPKSFDSVSLPMNVERIRLLVNNNKTLKCILEFHKLWRVQHFSLARSQDIGSKTLDSNAYQGSHGPKKSAWT
jgi:hypothetical protein